MPWRASIFARIHVGSDGQPPAGLCVRAREVACAAGQTAFKRAGLWDRPMQPNPVSSEVNWPDSAFLVKMLSPMCPRTAIKSGNY